MLKAKRKRWTAIRKALSGVRYWGIVILLAALLGGSVWLMRYIYARQPVATGSFTIGDQVPANTPVYNDLDLSLAMKAQFPSGPIKKLQTIGTTGGVSEYTVSFPVTDDHLTEYGLMTEPTSPRPINGYPVVILCHGYLTPSQYVTTKGYVSDMDFYSQHGYVVIKPDYRGQGLSAHDGTATSAYYSMGYNTDVMSLIDSVKQTGYLDKTNISLWGHSMGAYIALRAAVMSPDVKNLILLSGPVGNIQDMFKSYVPNSDASDPPALEARSKAILKYGSPLTNPNYWNNVTPLSYLNDTKADIQIFVGAMDRSVPPRFSAELDAALTKDHITHQYTVYPTGNHGLGPQRPQLWAASLQVMQAHP